MTRRQQYMADLRAALADVLGERQQVSIGVAQGLLAGSFTQALPGRVTIAKAMTGMGWHRIPRPGSGAVFARGDDA